MKCEEFKNRLVAPDLSAESDGPFTKHMEDCASCKNLYQLDAVMEDKIKSSFQKTMPPERLFRSLEKDMASHGRRKTWSRLIDLKRMTARWKKSIPAIAAAAMFLLILYPFAIKEKTSADEIGMLAIDNHTSNLPVTFQAGEIEDVPAWFEKQMGLKIKIPLFVHADFRFVGGRQCRLGEKDVAYLGYEKDGKRCSLFIADIHNTDFKMDQNRVYQFTDNKCMAKLWKDAGLLYAFVE